MKIDKYSAILGNTVGFHNMSTLTDHRPVASLPFGGKYRLIDFPLSSLANAGVRSVFGIFQQDNISSVFDHIRSGREWGLSTLLSHYYLGIYNTRVESSTVGKEYYQQLLTYLKRSGSNQTVALNCDVLINIDLNQVFHLHSTTKEPITVVYKKLAKKDISEVNAILDVDETDHVLSHKLFDSKSTAETFNMSTDIFVVDTPWLIEHYLLHVHDYHTAMIPFLLKEKYRWIQAYEDIETVLTIHNLEFQGQFSEGMLGDLFGVGFERYADGTLRWNNCLNWMKAGILYANRVSTVSPSYAHEIMTSQFGCNLDQILKMESGKVSGIVNGIDADLYNPQTDALLDYHFNQEDLSGKAKNKAKLQERVGLPVRADVPLVGIVSRLTRQKGFDVVVESLHHILQEDVQIVLLGTGDPAFEGAFSWFAQIYPDKLSANITFDVKLAQEIYAACDLFLMPSRFEPCGLSQMMAMRYGTLPLVHEVGGLRDTVRAFNPIEGSGTGFSFDNLSPYWLNWTFQTALDLYRNHPDIWRNLQKQAMESDFSWDTACKSYLDLYHSLVN